MSSRENTDLEIKSPALNRAKVSEVLGEFCLPFSQLTDHGVKRRFSTVESFPGALFSLRTWGSPFMPESRFDGPLV